jgi:DNA-cytosine methyltransferase
MKYFSMFSGVGGFELAIDGECVGFSEINKDAVDIYERHFNHRNFGDATAIDASGLPDFDLLVGGFPCQAFSIAGNRKGFDETRGTLFFDIARIIKAKQPKRVLLENVKGLLSHDNGRTFKTILSAFNELDYDTETMVLDGSDFKAGQRPRVFICATYRHDKANDRQRAEQAPSVYSSLSQRPRTTIYTIQEIGRSSARIIRTFAKLPDWLDGWETVYGAETPDGKRLMGNAAQPNTIKAIIKEFLL